MNKFREIIPELFLMLNVGLLIFGFVALIILVIESLLGVM